MANFKNIFEKFTYVWNITNLRYSTLQTEQSIRSPRISVPQFGNTIWFFEICPQGDTNESKDYISCFIYRGDDSGPENIEVNSRIWCSRTNIFSSKDIFSKNCSWGYKNFLSRNRNKHNHENELAITFELKVCDLFNSHNMDSYISSCLKTYFPHFGTVEEVKSPDEGKARALSKNDYTFPVKSFAQTKVSYDTITVVVPLDVSARDSLRKTIHLISKGKYPSTIIKLIVERHLRDRNNVAIVMDIDLTDKEIKKTLIVVCKMTFSSKTGKSFLWEKKHSFIAENKLLTWHLKRDFPNVILGQPNEGSSNEFSLKLEFTFSFGEIHSEIMNIKYVNIPRNFVSSGDEYVISKDMFRLYKEKKLCDVVLKVNNKTFEVHKVVLAAASPVFAAMFTNEMAEHKTNIVDIVDLDEDTVEEMISFLYTSSLKKMEYEFIEELFIAAHKYQISPLLYLCRNFMVDNIDEENIFEILSIADIYSDVKLEKKAVKFFKLKKNEILNSTEWEEFEKENSNLALKILRKVCLLHK